MRQGESELASECHLVGKFTLKDIPDGPAGEQTVKVTFDIDVDGLLKVNATALGADGISADLNIDNVSSNLSPERIAELQAHNAEASQSND